MKSKNIFDKAYSSLNETEKKFFSLLTNNEITKNEISSFLSTYDIDNQTASTSFLINILLEKYDFEAIDNPIIPRIKGLKDYFKFHNLTSLSRINKNESVVDIDLYLKLNNCGDIRGFSSKDSMLNESKFIRFVGKKYSSKVLASVKLNQDDYKLPGEAFLIDLLYLKLFLSITYSNNSQNIICYLYDIYKFGKEKEISKELATILDRKMLRHKIGGIKRWVLHLKK